MADEDGRDVDSGCDEVGSLEFGRMDSGPEIEGLTDAWGTPQRPQTLEAEGLNPGGLR